MVLSVLGQTLQGNFSFSSQTAAGVTTVMVQASGVSLMLGDGTNTIVSATGDIPGLTISNAGIAGSFNATVAVNIPGVSMAGAFAVQIDTTAASKFVRVSGTGVSLTVAGQTLTGNFTLEQTTTQSNEQVVRIGVTGLSLELRVGREARS